MVIVMQRQYRHSKQITKVVIIKIMTALKPLFYVRPQLTMLLLLVLALGTEKEMAKAQNSTCSNQLSNYVNVCAPFVVPGVPNTSPSTGCCAALRAVDTDCLCNTLRMASLLPSQCQLPPLACG